MDETIDLQMLGMMMKKMLSEMTGLRADVKAIRDDIGALAGVSVHTSGRIDLMDKRMRVIELAYGHE